MWSVIFTYLVLCLAYTESLDSSETGGSEKLVVTKKYHMSGEEFVRLYYEKNKALRITNDYRDWPLYNYWLNDAEELGNITIDVTKKSAGQDEKPVKMTLKEIKQSKSNTIFSNHIITEEQEMLAESVLLPITVLSCRDLYKNLLKTAVFYLYLSSDNAQSVNLFESNTYAIVISGEWHVTLCPDCAPVTFNEGELIYVPPDLKMYKWHSEGLFLAAKLTWPRIKTSDETTVQCMPITLQTANFREGWSRNTNASARINGTRLNTGYEIPPIGFGTEKLHGKTYDSVMHALKIGYRLIDTSKSYFGSDDQTVSSEIEIGRAMTDSNIQRNDILVSVKISTNIIKDNIADLVHDSIKNLGSEYIDILILELPFRVLENDHPYPEQTQKIWADLKVLQANRIIRSLGICNVKNVQELGAILKFTGNSLSIVQNWFDLFRLDEEIRAECKNHRIIYMGYGLLGARRMFMEKREKNPILTDPTVANTAPMIDAPKGSFVLRWAMMKNIVVTPCSSDEYHIETNFYTTVINMHEQDLAIMDEAKREEIAEKEAIKDEL